MAPRKNRKFKPVESKPAPPPSKGEQMSLIDYANRFDELLRETQADIDSSWAELRQMLEECE